METTIDSLISIITSNINDVEKQKNNPDYSIYAFYVFQGQSAAYQKILEVLNDMKLNLDIK